MIDQIRALYPTISTPLEREDGWQWDRPGYVLLVLRDGSWRAHRDPGLTGEESGPDIASAAAWLQRFA